ncbi:MULTISPECIES: flagellar hook-basal body complex protein FliE [unclassified Paraburkholderia]|uniref:flagellar hook-basal body complex protein FliE n=1 Tax=unclassified Paraburkholderia TaxID=2615204 RepID=UPI0016129FCD|nr:MULTISPECIES: flagellar hook-basal body complex protein FliE [unclassified Paraburkholderia]MBB5447939.1 flagellar hook-basal body complex protein FliE [Paraburkholderia sp. WSM4177]MBB5488354.1 flagellar hook-basal body complex protein FliE [Paraburkholderia sp. WSM4180]
MSIAVIPALEPGFLAPTWQTGLAPSLASQVEQGLGATTQPGFGALLVDGLQSVDTQVSTANAAIADFALGADLPPHQVMMALEQARISLQFALQIRSRLVEGYQELMRMQL